MACARDYAAGGAAALSVLTDERYFGGRLEYLGPVRAASPLPLLRKDFVIDPYQVDEARAAGADAVLLIVAALGAGALRGAARATPGRGASTRSSRCTTRGSWRSPSRAGADLVGVNNRDLRSFVTDLTVTERLAPRVPPGVLLVAESGIAGPADVARLARAGARAFLVGESLMREAEPGERRCAGFAERRRAGPRDGANQGLWDHPSRRRRGGGGRRRGPDRDQLRPGLAAARRAPRRRRRSRSAWRGSSSASRSSATRRWDEVERVTRRIDFERVQLHGQESEADVEMLDLPVIKAIRGADLEAAQQYPGALLLLDHPTEGGGRGQGLELVRRRAS